MEKLDFSNGNEVQKYFDGTSQPTKDIKTDNTVKKRVSRTEINSTETLADVSVDTAINEAELEYAQNGILLDAKEALSALRKKHFGQAP